MNAVAEQLIRCLKDIFPDHYHDRIFLVGGSVRDLLLGKPGADLDLAAALTTAEFAGCGFHLVTGRSTAPIWFQHRTGVGTLEITPLKSASELASNLADRDFTVNAIAMDMNGRLADPLGGADDLRQRRLCVCGTDTFERDPLRIFRALRFASDGWHMTSDCQELIRRHDWTAALRRIPVERFSREMIKALAADRPEMFFQFMLELQVGTDFLPELFRLPQIPAGPLIHHPEGDLFTHSSQVLQRVAATTDDPLARFCGFFHDIGKLATDPASYPRHHGHDQAGFELARKFCTRLRLPASYRNALAWTSRLHGTLNLWDQLRIGTRIKTAEKAFKAGIAEILPLVAAADKASGTELHGWPDALKIATLTTTELGIDTAALAKIPPGKRADRIFQVRVERLRTTIS